jgi:1,4-alpha-glucan branching enzyme
VDFVQNHDQVGNRALGDRLTETVPCEAIRALHAILLLSPHPPLLFMGEEFMATTPFQFFCDFGKALADAVREGRRDEFRAFPQFRETEIPDPNAESTFDRSKLDWDEALNSGYLPALSQILKIRAAEIVPRLEDAPGAAARWEVFGATALAVHWTLGDGTGLWLRTNPHPGSGPRLPERKGRLLWSTHPTAETGDPLPPWYVVWSLEELRGP